MKKTIFFYSLLVLFPFILPAQNVTLKGKATGAEGMTLSVYVWSDQITFTQTKIASGKIDSAGYFSFSFKADKTIFTYLKIDFYQAPIYIEPRKTYNLVITCPDCKSPNDKINTYFSPKELPVVIGGADSTELNNAIISFNTEYDHFLLDNFISLMRKRDKAKSDTFRMKIEKRFGTIKNDYFTNLVEYRLATIEESAQLKSQEMLANIYVRGQAVIYDNSGYMEFFNEFFKNFLTSGSKYITGADLERTINIAKSFPALMDSLGKDTILRNEVVRELVALKGLGEIYYQQGFDKVSVLNMFKYVMANSKFPQHKIIAQNYLELFTKLTPGTVAPAFTLKDYTGKSYSLAEFNKGKYVYLIFWTTWCVPCLAEMDLIGKIKTKYGTRVEFVGISADKEFLKYYYFMEDKKKFDFTTLHWGNNTDLLENYNVKAYPTFVLIGPDGNIVQCPAEPPSGNLNELFYDLTKGEKKK